ncbi:integrase arm-type DNA-binding domain-containing protein [Brevundimonas sp.]|uniref:integrase arm-type DNA-binding domain-containing protein n=1 Tax=Brevundimonas sp. TaxID=1871086 RepID=UPI0035AF647F
MASVKISTDRQVAALRPGAKPYEVTVEKSRGLCVRVFPTGIKKFEYRYVAGSGARRRHRLGQYPGLSLSEAKATVAALSVGVVNGEDPAEDRARERERARTGDTLSGLAETYWKAAEKGLHGGRRRPKRPISIANERGLWRKHVAPTLGARRFEELRRADIKAFMRALATESGLAPASLASVGTVIQGVLGFAVDEERLEANPAVGLARPLALKARERLFSACSRGDLASGDDCLHAPPRR